VSFGRLSHFTHFLLSFATFTQGAVGHLTLSGTLDLLIQFDKSSAGEAGMALLALCQATNGQGVRADSVDRQAQKGRGFSSAYRCMNQQGRCAITLISPIFHPAQMQNINQELNTAIREYLEYIRGYSLDP
jgi:hypothetical protein